MCFENGMEWYKFSRSYIIHLQSLSSILLTESYKYI